MSNFTDKITTPEDAVSCIKPGDRVFVGTGCATPRTLTLALENLNQHLEDVQCIIFWLTGPSRLKTELQKQNFTTKHFSLIRICER